jgi:multidrug efflux pump subunit AcrA (membrane-fusion protein)
VGQLELVEVIGSDGGLTRRFVRTGRLLDDNVEILSGLSEGEQVALPTRE